MSEIVVRSDTIEHGGKQVAVRVLQFGDVEVVIRRRETAQDRIDTTEVVNLLIGGLESLSDESKKKHAKYGFINWYGAIVVQTVRVKGFSLPPRHATVEEHVEAYFSLDENYDLFLAWFTEADDMSKPPNRRYLRPDATEGEKKAMPPKGDSSANS